MIINTIMVPAISISKMLEIVRDEDIVSSYSTEQLKDILNILQNEKLTRFREDEDYHSLRCESVFIASAINKDDIERFIKLEETIIGELSGRGEYTPSKKYSR